MYANRLPSKLRRRSAFTLIELLLVLVILAVLTAIVVQNFGGVDDKAKANATKTSLAAIASSIDRFKLENGRFPTSQEGINALLEKPNDLPNWSGPYLKLQSLKDGWNHDFIYVFPGNHNNDYDLYSYGKDGADGGGDDIDNWSPQ